jgi:hypothetical protein
LDHRGSSGRFFMLNAGNISGTAEVFRVESRTQQEQNHEKPY